jgi:thiol-disulfide isomerase/thioredoxin
MRHRAKWAAAAAAVLFIAAAVQAVGDAALTGRPAPEIQATDWIHGDGRTTLADFKGEVVLLEFWKTHCPASRGEVRHLAKLADDFGKKGLEVVALTSDDDRRALERFLTHFDPSPNYRIAVGGASGYAVTNVPCAVLIGADGKVLVDGTAGRSISDKDVAAALKSVRAPSPEDLEARAAKRLAFAETFAADRFFARADYELRETVRLYGTAPSAKKAAERLKSFAEGDVALELDAQKDVAKIANLNATFEHADDKPKPADAESLAKRLSKKADELRARTPRAAKLAETWAAVYADPWK